MRCCDQSVSCFLFITLVPCTLLDCTDLTHFCCILSEIESSALAATISLGYNSKMEPMLSSGGGVYKLVNIKADKSYAVKVSLGISR